MPKDAEVDVDVVIAGAGPIGLFLACELGLAKVSVLVLEREAKPESPWKTEPLGTRGLNTVSAEAFYRRGFLKDTKIFSEARPHTLEKTDGFQFAGHFAGMMLDANKVDLKRWPYRLPGPGLLPGPTSMERIENALTERALQHGVKIVRGKGVTGLSQDRDSVTVQAGEQTYRAKWLVGCDGGRSTVRKAAGFEFVGTEAQFTGYSAMCELADPEKLEGGWNKTRFGLYIAGRPGHYVAMDYDGASFDRSQSITAEHFQSVLRRASGTDVTVKKLHLATSFTDRSKQATTYLKGRVLLAGDAAHIHSPLGAQGLNAGIGDAMNLGWKLAACVHGTAPGELLGTYTQERHPIAAWVLEWTRAQVSTLKPDLFGQAVANLIGDLSQTVDGTNYLVDRIWGLSQRYDLGDPHPLVGSSAPDFEFTDGTRLGPKLERGRGLVLDFGEDAALAALARRWQRSVDYVHVPPRDALGLRALIVRPDGTVAWLSQGEAHHDRAQGALERWFGPTPPKAGP